jgi:hypothetical protein
MPGAHSREGPEAPTSKSRGKSKKEIATAKAAAPPRAPCKEESVGAEDPRAELISSARLENLGEARVAAARIGLETKTRKELATIAKGLEVHRARSGQSSLGLTASSVGCSSADDLAERISALCRDPVTSEMVSILLHSLT